ncbi:hypothetical protein [Marinicrinis sediminis]|uniref:Uncharacterized protein n=1 Tax=Marinicrinis sediminis TaxID=1652465 RepID=A0ABW5R7P8_9BACL
MKIQGAYNCVLAGVYNDLVHNHQLSFSFEQVALQPGYFQLDRWNHWLVIPNPQLVIESFLRYIGAELIFPDLQDVQQAEQVIRGRLSRGDIVPIAINLRHSVLDPVPFDSDNWNFQLITRQLDDHTFEMFDMYHSQCYKATSEQVHRMICTPFNERLGGFTPCPVVQLHDGELTRTRLAESDLFTLYLDTINSYDLPYNLDQSRQWLQAVKHTFTGLSVDRMYEYVYRLMGHQMLIVKSRTEFADFLATHLGDRYAQQLKEWGGRWMELVNGIPKKLYRGATDEGMQQLEEELVLLLEWESAILSQASTYLRGGERC